MVVKYDDPAVLAKSWKWGGDHRSHERLTLGIRGVGRVSGPAQLSAALPRAAFDPGAGGLLRALRARQLRLYVLTLSASPCSLIGWWGVASKEP